MSISENNTRIQVTIPKDLKPVIEEKAGKDKRSVSNYVLMLILKDLNKDSS